MRSYVVVFLCEAKVKRICVINVSSRRLEPQAGRYYETSAGRPPAVAVNKDTHTHTHTVSSPKKLNWLFPWHPLPLLPSDSVCTACVCALPASHNNITCISSSSQANPPPIIVNADSIDAGPYVSIWSPPSLYSIHLSPPRSLLFAWAQGLFVCVWRERPPPASNMLFAMWTDIHYASYPAGLGWMCILQSRVFFLTRCLCTVKRKDTFWLQQIKKSTL